MKKIELEKNEKYLLSQEIHYSIIHRKKQVYSMSVYILLGVSIGGLLSYWKHGLSISLIFFSVIFFFIILIPLLISSYSALKRIKNLQNDLKSGFKITGSDKIESINFFNRAIKLSNGIKVFEPEEKYKTFSKNDIIKFKVSLSNAYIFECVKE